MHACRVVRHRVAPALVAGLATASLSLISTQAVGASPPGNGAVSIGSSAETGELFGVAATPGGDAWAVGYSGTNPATKSLILYWNGSHWKPVPSPSPPGASLRSVAATSSTNAWAVGYSGDATNTQTLILHRNGKTWRQMPSTAGTLSGVAATSPTNAWAVGATNSGSTLILHWNGKAWRQMPSTAGTLSGVAATSPTNAWAVGATNSGSTLILHWNGKAWQQMPSPSPGSEQGLASFLSGVAVSSGGTIWAVGNGNSCGCGPGDELDRAVERAYVGASANSHVRRRRQPHCRRVTALGQIVGRWTERKRRRPDERRDLAVDRHRLDSCANCRTWEVTTVASWVWPQHPAPMHGPSVGIVPEAILPVPPRS